ncbi:DinB family protein [Fluviicola taffensis]|uniref:DinB family protein n=1 Tax=Fluviicola taffensis TaxID=191579 RepID=UPI003137EBBD
MTTDQTMVKIILDRWEASVKNCDTLVNSLSDEQLQREIAPGKNRGIYILGHLIAVHDHMLPLLDLGKANYGELDKAFIESPDKAVSELPSVAELRSMWNKQKEELKQQFDKLSAENWFERHTSVSEEDFAKEPHRNKLNIILTRTTHLAYHTGQLVYLK